MVSKKSAGLGLWVCGALIKVYYYATRTVGDPAMLADFLNAGHSV